MRLLISRREAQMTGKRLPLGVRSNPFNIGVGAGRPLAFTSVIIIVVIVITIITICSNFPICFNQGWAVLISLLINIIAIDEQYKSCNLRRANCLTLKLAKAQHYQLPTHATIWLFHHPHLEIGSLCPSCVFYMLCLMWIVYDYLTSLDHQCWTMCFTDPKWNTLPRHCVPC